MHRIWGPLLFSLYTIPSVAGLVVMKHGLTTARESWSAGTYFGMPTLIVAAGVCLYVFSFLIWLLILARYDLSLAYPVAIGLTLAFSTLAASVALGELLSLTRLVGIAVIFFGVWLVSR